MRIFKPWMSASELISLLNQPAICVPELPVARGSTPNGSYNSRHSSMPPPNRSQPFVSWAFMPKGAVVNMAAMGILPRQ